jgi:acetyl esterase/lipase
MKKFAFSIFLTLISFTIFAQDKVIDLWTVEPPTDNELSGPEVDEGNNRVSNISVAKMYIYTPDEEINTGAAVILLPGGGYRREAMSHEGYEVGEWLKSKGITGIILKYRLPNGHHQVPLEDANRAVRYTRFNAEKWGINPNKIGIGGASAGGHLASMAGTRFDAGNKNSDDPVETFSSRPDFVLMLYPFIFIEEGKLRPTMKERLFGGEDNWEIVKNYSSERNVTSDTPPCMLIHADNDEAVPPLHSIKFYSALKNHNIPAEMHIFTDGGHGFGITKQNLPSDNWPNLFYDWLKTIKIIE